MLKPSHLIRNYKINFHENRKLIGTIYVAASDSLEAENIGLKMAAKNVVVTVSRDKELIG